MHAAAVGAAAPPFCSDGCMRALPLASRHSDRDCFGVSERERERGRQGSRSAYPGDCSLRSFCLLAADEGTGMLAVCAILMLHRTAMADTVSQGGARSRIRRRP